MAADSGADDDARETLEPVGDESCSEKKFFEEHAQVAQLLAELLAAADGGAADEEVDAAFEHKCTTIAGIVRIPRFLLYRVPERRTR